MIIDCFNSCCLFFFQHVLDVLQAFVDFIALYDAGNLMGIKFTSALSINGCWESSFISHLLCTSFCILDHLLFY